MSVNIENTNLTKWELNDTEIAYYVNSPYGSSSGSLPLYIPKLMPNISMGKARSTRVNLNKSCYCNDSGCKPPVSSQLSYFLILNYITDQIIIQIMPPLLSLIIFCNVSCNLI